VAVLGACGIFIVVMVLVTNAASDSLVLSR